MHDAIGTITKLYLVSAAWFIVMLTIALVSLPLMSGAYSSIDASPLFRATSTMAVAIVAASTIAAMAWARLRPTATPAVAVNDPDRYSISQIPTKQA
ncbi:MAG: hypothetical protein ACC726_16460 [Chloroflexota bacterium]